MLRELDLEQLAKDREDATLDKADLFDFYNSNWDRLVAELEKHKSKREMLDAASEARTLKKVFAYLQGWGVNDEILAGIESGECLKKK